MLQTVVSIFDSVTGCRIDIRFCSRLSYRYLILLQGVISIFDSVTFSRIDIWLLKAVVSTFDFVTGCRINKENPGFLGPDRFRSHQCTPFYSIGYVQLTVYLLKQGFQFFFELWKKLDNW